MGWRSITELSLKYHSQRVCYVCRVHPYGSDTLGKRIRDAALSTFIHHYTFAAKSKSIKYDSRRTI